MKKPCRFKIIKAGSFSSKQWLQVTWSNLLSMSVFWISLLLMGCIKEVNDIKIPQSPPKLAIAAFISPQDTVIRVSVVKSAPVLGKNSFSRDNIKDAIVKLSDGTHSVTLPYNERERNYTVDATSFPILPGKTYFLQVSNSEGLQAEAFCTVPVLQNNTLEMETDSTMDEYGKSYTLDLKWKDTAGEINYYRIAAERQTTYLYRRRDTGVDTVLGAYDLIFWDGTEFYADNRLDGTSFSSPKGRIIGTSYYEYDPNVQKVYSSTLYGYLLNTDEHYYRYHQSIRTNSNDNPFAEPTPIYSNVSGGLGIFAAYTRTTVSLKLK